MGRGVTKFPCPCFCWKLAVTGTRKDQELKNLRSKIFIAMDKNEKLNVNIGFIGAGNMARAIGEGIIRAGIVDPGQLTASAPTMRCLSTWKELGAHTTHSNAEVVQKSDIIFLAVKPHILDGALSDIIVPAKGLFPSKLFVSVMAGITIETLETKLSRISLDPRVIRTMPNTPVSIGEGCTVFTPGKSATPADISSVKLILSSVGICEMVQEPLIYSAGTLTGSGVAFMYTVIEALSDGAVKMGVPRAMATSFAAQTLLGASKMVLESGRHPGQLKDEVCSPGGTTIAGIHALERGGLRSSLMDAIEAAVNKSFELGKK